MMTFIQCWLLLDVVSVLAITVLINQSPVYE